MFIPEIRDGVGVITLQSPNNLNLLCKIFIKNLNAELDMLENDPSVKVIVIRGQNGFFSAGANVKELSTQTESTSLQHDYLKEWHHISSCEKPILTCVNGHAIGGGAEIAIQGDFVFMGTSAVMQFPEINLGLFPGGGGCVRLIRAIGYQRALGLCVSGAKISARAAHDMNLVYKICDDHILDAEVLKFAHDLAIRPLNVLKQIKSVFKTVEDLPLNDALEYERRAFYRALDADTTKEGFAAFHEKRDPDWSKF